MVPSDLKRSLPTSAELPSSDDTPVDNEDQNFLPNFLLFLLNLIWEARDDWFFSVDMGIYHTTGVNPRVPVVPDGFLSLGVERRKGGKSRPSYVVWEENDVVPMFTLEMVSHTPGGEYDSKLEIYARLGVLYYIIYNPDYWKRDLEEISALADRHQPFEVYKLINGSYQLQIGEPYWMPEVDLGIGRFQRVMGGIQREFLYWFDQQGNRYLASDELEQQANQQLELERQRADRLAARLRELGEDPDRL